MRKNYLLMGAMLLIALISCQNDLDSSVVNDPEGDQMAQNDKLLPPFPDVKGEILTLKSGALVEKKGDLCFWEGDILLSNAQLEQLAETGNVMTPPQNIDTTNQIPAKTFTGMKYIPQDRLTRNNGVYPTSYNLWAMVRYTVDSDILPSTRNLIRQAIAQWESRTNIRFYNATGQPTKDPIYGFDYPYVRFHNGKGNWSYVGRIDGEQLLSIDGKEGNLSAVVHEIGHAIGLHHEQCRYDRDNYININLNNLDQNKLKPSNYTKVTQSYYCIGAFDWESIMLYGSFDGAKKDDGQAINAVMTRKNNTTWADINLKQLSDLDRLWANNFYLPYVARSDVYRELDAVVYDKDNRRLTESERIQLQAQLNKGNSTPPAGGRIPNVH